VDGPVPGFLHEVFEGLAGVGDAGGVPPDLGHHRQAGAGGVGQLVLLYGLRAALQPEPVNLQWNGVRSEHRRLQPAAHLCRIESQ